MRTDVIVSVIVGALMLATVVAFLVATAGLCANRGGAWCYVSPVGDGYVNPR